jgi:hypothetical protein
MHSYFMPSRKSMKTFSQKLESESRFRFPHRFRASSSISFLIFLVVKKETLASRRSSSCKYGFLGMVNTPVQMDKIYMI